MKKKSARRVADALYKKCGIIGLKKTAEVLETMRRATKKRNDCRRFRKDIRRIAVVLEKHRLKIVRAKKKAS